MPARPIFLDRLRRMSAAILGRQTPDGEMVLKQIHEDNTIQTHLWKLGLHYASARRRACP